MLAAKPVEVEVVEDVDIVDKDRFIGVEERLCLLQCAACLQEL